MNNITLNSKTCRNRAETPVKLQNGSLVLHFNSVGEPLGAYLVTSYRDQQDWLKYRNKVSTVSYCTLINLDTGYIQFEEPCSRTTTVGRVLAHLSKTRDEGKIPVGRGERIEVYPSGKFNINLSYFLDDSIVREYR